MSYLIKPSLIVFILLGIFSLVWLRSSIIAVEYEIGTLDAEKAKAVRQKKALIAKRASALSMGEIGSRGMKLAGMGYPDRKRVVYVKKEVWGTYSLSAQGGATPGDKGAASP